MPEKSTPDQTYGAAYNALSERIARQYAGQRAGLNQQLASSHVLGSGVSAAPMAALGSQEAGALNSAAENIGQNQAQNAIARRWMGEDYAQQMKLSQMYSDWQRRNAERQGRNSLTGGIVGGGLAAVGAVYGGPMGAMAGYQAGNAVGQSL